jgi:calcineurin-like phosphoesterase family protein
MTTFFTSDTHFGHENMLQFEPHIYPQASIDERDEFLIDLWNKKVGPKDKVVHLGDAAFNSRLPIFERLNGRKILVMGNHDTKKAVEYLKYFEDLKGAYMWRAGDIKAVCTHIPVHPWTLDRWNLNIHGHLHEAHIPDPRYLCVSVEQTGLAPISGDEIIERLGNQHAVV